MWKTIRSCIPKKSISTRYYNENDKTAVTKFNLFFVSVGKTTLDKTEKLAKECGYNPAPKTFPEPTYPSSEQFAFLNLTAPMLSKL